MFGDVFGCHSWGVARIPGGRGPGTAHGPVCPGQPEWPWCRGRETLNDLNVNKRKKAHTHRIRNIVFNLNKGNVGGTRQKWISNSAWGKECDI